MKTRRLGSRPSWLSNHAPHRDVGPCLLAGVRCFFDGHAVAVEATPDRTRRKTHAVLCRQPVRQFYERDIALSLDLGQQEA